MSAQEKRPFYSTDQIAIMIACTDSWADFLQKASWHLMFCTSAALLASMGCSQGESSHSATIFQGVDPQLVSRHGQLQFVHDFEVGRRISQETRKPCLLFFTADWCTYCRQMEETAFTDPSIKNLSENFVCVLVDADQHPELCQEFAVTGFPTIQFLSAQGRQLNRLVGRQSAADLATGMQAAIKRFAWLNDPNTQVR